MLVGVSMETLRVCLPWGQVNRLEVAGNYVFCLVIVVNHMKGKRVSHKEGWGNLIGGVDPSASLSELPTYFRLLGCKKSSMICTK